MAITSPTLKLAQTPFSLFTNSQSVSSKPNSLPLSSLLGSKLTIERSIPRTHFVFNLNRRATTATMSFSLPSTKADRASYDKLPNESNKVVCYGGIGGEEAQVPKYGYPNTGTEALLMGILVEGTSIAAKFLRSNGITLFKVREETVNLLGRSDLYYFSPEHPPLTEPAQKALDWAVDEKLKSEKESAGYKILEALGFNDSKTKELAKSMDKDIDLSWK